MDGGIFVSSYTLLAARMSRLGYISTNRQDDRRREAPSVPRCIEKLNLVFGPDPISGSAVCIYISSPGMTSPIEDMISITT